MMWESPPPSGIHTQHLYLLSCDSLTTPFGNMVRGGTASQNEGVNKCDGKWRRIRTSWVTIIIRLRLNLENRLCLSSFQMVNMYSKVWNTECRKRNCVEDWRTFLSVQYLWRCWISCKDNCSSIYVIIVSIYHTSAFGAFWLVNSEVISKVLFTSEQPKRNKMASCFASVSKEEIISINEEVVPKNTKMAPNFGLTVLF